eukprot:scaffold1516_cov230-Pinguiococcus_pyrenoidosus.AAC.4
MMETISRLESDLAKEDPTGGVNPLEVPRPGTEPTLPGRPGAQPTPLDVPPRGDFQGDLDPPTLRPPGAGGNLMGPDHPIFSDQGRPRVDPRLPANPGMAPRFDPWGPVVGPNTDPRRPGLDPNMGGRPRGPRPDPRGLNPEPDADHMRMMYF